jgi:hypothetical protein
MMSDPRLYNESAFAAKITLDERTGIRSTEARAKGMGMQQSTRLRSQPVET